MIDRIRKAQDEDSGFTLIELLVVVIIIGILAAIAIPVFLNQRQSAWQGSVESDLRNAAISVETYFTQNNEYHEDALTEQGTDWTSADEGSEGVTVTWGDNQPDNGFCLEGTHADLGGTTTAYDSTAGGVQGADTSC